MGLGLGLSPVRTGLGLPGRRETLTEGDRPAYGICVTFDSHGGLHGRGIHHKPVKDDDERSSILSRFVDCWRDVEIERAILAIYNDRDVPQSLAARYVVLWVGNAEGCRLHN